MGGSVMYAVLRAPVFLNFLLQTAESVVMTSLFMTGQQA